MAKNSDTQTTPQANTQSIVQIVISLIVILYLLLRVAGKIPTTNSLGNAELILLGTILLFNSTVIERLKNFNISKDGVQVQLDQIAQQQEGLQKNQDAQTSDIGQLASFLIHNLISEYELNHLKNIESENPPKYKIIACTKAELRHLRGLKFIEKKQDFSLTGMPEGKEVNLKDLFMVTDKGKKYLQLLNEYGDVEELKLTEKSKQKAKEFANKHQNRGLSVATK